MERFIFPKRRRCRRPRPRPGRRRRRRLRRRRRGRRRRRLSVCRPVGRTVCGLGAVRMYYFTG